jgi:hypothetical protein
MVEGYERETWVGTNSRHLKLIIAVLAFEDSYDLYLHLLSHGYGAPAPRR